MKICITSSGDNTDSILDPRFGRCAYFILVDIATGTEEAVANEAGAGGGGAGISSGQFMVDKGIHAIITGNVGPNAMSVLKAAKIDIYKGRSETVKNNIEYYKQGNLERISTTVSSHFGLGNRG